MDEDEEMAELRAQEARRVRDEAKKCLRHASFQLMKVKTLLAKTSTVPFHPKPKRSIPSNCPRFPCSPLSKLLVAGKKPTKITLPMVPASIRSI